MGTIIRSATIYSVTLVITILYLIVGNVTNIFQSWQGWIPLLPAFGYIIYKELTNTGTIFRVRDKKL